MASRLVASCHGVRTLTRTRDGLGLGLGQVRTRTVCVAGEPLHLLSQYFELFGQKRCCFADIRPYLCLLGEQQQHEASEPS